jgi:hypothetical protein
MECNASSYSLPFLSFRRRWSTIAHRPSDPEHLISPTRCSPHCFPSRRTAWQTIQLATYKSSQHSNPQNRHDMGNTYPLRLSALLSFPKFHVLTNTLDVLSPISSALTSLTPTLRPPSFVNEMLDFSMCFLPWVARSWV